MEASPRPWAHVSPPSVRVPGPAGASLVFAAVPSPAAFDAGLGAIGVDIALTTPSHGAVYRRRPVSTDFCDRLRRFFRTAASDSTTHKLETFEDGFSGISIRLVDSTDFVLTLAVAVVAHEEEDTDSIDSLVFETSRVALITASQQVAGLVTRDELQDPPWTTEPALPLDLLYRPETHRLTGIYRLARWIHGRQLVAATHLIRFPETAEGDLETSLLTSMLPFASVAANGVDERRQPWAIITQVLPEVSETHIAGPWDPVQVAREEINHAIHGIERLSISGESITDHTALVRLFETRGVPHSSIDDWSVEDLALTAIAELTNAPLANVVRGRLTDCAFPDYAHDCPKDFFDCTFARWQEMLFNADGHDLR